MKMFRSKQETGKGGEGMGVLPIFLNLLLRKFDVFSAL